MTTEATPPPEPNVNAPGDEGAFARVDAAIKMLEAEDKPPPAEPAPEPEPEPEAKPAPEPEPKTETEAKPDEDPIPTLDELRAEIAQRRQGKPAQREEKQQQREDERIAEALEAVPKAEFARDPKAALERMGLNPREVMRTLAHLTLGKEAPKQKSKAEAPDIAKLVEEKVREALAPYEERETARQATEQRQQAEEAFLEEANDAEKYPYLGTLTDEERIDYGDRIAIQLSEAGRPVTFDLVARVLNQHMKSLAERFRTAGGSDTADTDQSASGSETTEAKPPKSLSQSLPATRPPKKEPQTEEERIEAAIRIAEADG